MRDINGKSDIGNFYGFLKEYSDGNKPELSYFSRNWADISQWKVMARAKLFELLNYFPEKAPLDAKVLEVKHKDGYRQEEIEFSTAKNVRVKGTVLIPENQEKCYPAIIGIHDHGGFYFYGREKIVEQEYESPLLREFKQKAYGGRSWANELVKRGYIVLCIDGFYFGSRKLNISEVSDDIPERFGANFESLDYGSDEYIREFNNFSAKFEDLLVKHIFTSGTTWPGILFHDDRICINYLYTREDVDKNRIGCCGLSIGGFRAAHLAALDDRIKCSVVTGWMPTYSSLLFNRLRNHTFMIYIPGITNYMELPDVMSLTAPNPLFIQQCSRDSLFPLEGMQKSCEAIQNVYNKMGRSEKFKFKFYDNGHEFSIEMQEDAFSWFDRWFKG